MLGEPLLKRRFCFFRCFRRKGRSFSKRGGYEHHPVIAVVVELDRRSLGMLP
jgi:hypothetical protein